MAEKPLGPISYTEEGRGTSAVDESYRARLVAQGLDIGKTVLDESIKASVTGDMLDVIGSMDNTVKSADINPAITYGEGTRERYLANRLDRLQSVIAQGNTNQRDLAEIQIKSILAEAQRKYPWLYSDLQSRAGQVIAGSAELDALGLGDSARKEQATQAQQMYDDMVDFSQQAWKEDGTGGLGIDPAIGVGTPQWNFEYARRSKLRTEIVNQQIQTAMAMNNAAADLNDDTFYDTLLGTLTGKYSLNAGSQEAIRQEFGYYKLLEEIHKGKDGDINYIRDWQQLYGNQMLSYVQIKREELDAFFMQNIRPDQENSPRGKTLRKRLDDIKLQYDALEAALKTDLESLPDSIRFAESVMAANQFVQYQDLPPQAQTAYEMLSTPSGQFIIDMIKDSNFPDAMAIMANVQKLGTNMFLESAGHLIGPNATPTNRAAEVYNMSPGAMGITSVTSPSAINSAIRSRHANPGDNYIVETKNPKEEAIAAISSMDTSLGLWRQASQQQGPFATAEGAATALTGFNYGLHTLVTQDQNYDEVNTAVLDQLASKDIWEAVSTAGDGPFANQRMAFGQTAQDFYALTRPAERRIAAKATYNDTVIGGEPLAALALVDVNAIKSGSFRWVIQEDALKRAIEKERRPAKAGRIGAGRELASDARNRVVKRINDTMTAIQGELEQQIAIESMLDRATSPSAEQRNRGGDFKNYFLGIGDDSPVVWSEIFNYTEGSMY